MRNLRNNGSALGAIPTVDFIADKIQVAVSEDKKRAVHGDTAFNSFYITSDGKIYPNTMKNRLPRQRPAPDTIDVHSHSADNWYYWSEITGAKEPFVPFSRGDFQVLRHEVLKGVANTLALIMGDGRMDLLHCPADSENKFLSFSDRQVDQMVYLPKDWHLSKKWEGYRWYEVLRERQKEFAEKAGLLYVQGLRWKPEERREELYRRRPEYEYPEPTRPEPKTIYTKKEARPGRRAILDLTKSFWHVIPGRSYPIEPTQAELFYPAPKILTKGTYYHLYPLPYIQERLFEGQRRKPRLSGRIMNCGIWVPGVYDLKCGKYGPSCEGQANCIQPDYPGQLKKCVQTQDIKPRSARYKAKKIKRCYRYRPACATGACLSEPMLKPRPPEPDPKTVKSIAESLAIEYNESYQPYIAREILSRGGIRSYRKGYLKEEYREVPVFLRRKTGLPPDEMASEMGLTETELIEAIKKAYPRGKRLEQPRTWRDFMSVAYNIALKELERKSEFGVLPQRQRGKRLFYMFAEPYRYTRHKESVISIPKSKLPEVRETMLTTGGALYYVWAKSADEARDLIETGRIRRVDRKTFEVEI